MCNDDGIQDLYNVFSALSVHFLCMSSNFIFKGQQGFPLSAIVDEPNLRVNGFTTAQTSVHLICQKNQGMQHPTSQYVIVNCQIVVDTPGFAGKVRANIDSLLPTLSHYISQVIVRQFDQYAKKILIIN